MNLGGRHHSTTTTSLLPSSLFFFLRVRWYLPQEVEEVGFGLAGAFNDFGV